MTMTSATLYLAAHNFKFFRMLNSWFLRLLDPCGSIMKNACDKQKERCICEALLPNAPVQGSPVEETAHDKSGTTSRKG